MSSQEHAENVIDALQARLPPAFHLIRDPRQDHLKLFIQPHGRRLPKFYVEVWDDQIITMEVSGHPYGHNVHSLKQGPFAVDDIEGFIAYFQHWLSLNPVT